MKKTRIIKYSIGVTVLIIAVITFLKMYNNKQIIITSEATYPLFTLEELKEKSQYVIYGKVKSKEKSIIEKVHVKDKNLEDNDIIEVLTPVTIEIIDSIKNPDYKQEILYLEEGGETDEYIMKSDIPTVDKSEKMIIFIASNGKTFGEQGILRVKDNIVSYIDTKDKVKKTKELKEFIKELKSY